MSAQTFAQRFIASNPLPETPNPLVNQVLGDLRILFCKLWLFRVVDAMARCAVALKRCRKLERGAVFTRGWESWQKSLMHEIEWLFSLLLDIGRANGDCALPDPASWAFDCMYRLIGEHLVWMDKGEHVVAYWVKKVCRWNPVEIWEAATTGMYGVSATNAQIRDSDLIIPLLSKSFEQAMLSHLNELRTLAWVQLAKQGWRSALEDRPIVRLKDLGTLAPRDARRKETTREIYRTLRSQILEARGAVTLEKISIGTVKQRFSHLQDVDDVLIRDWVLDSSKTECVAARELIRIYDGNASPETVNRYTRYVSDARDVTAQASSDSKDVPSQHIVSLLPPELLPRYEKLRVA